MQGAFTDLASSVFPTSLYQTLAWRQWLGFNRSRIHGEWALISVLLRLARYGRSEFTIVQYIVHVGVVMRVVSFSEARNGLKKIIDSVVANADYTVISRRDAPDAVLMSLDTFNSMMETAYLLKTSANAAHLAKSIGQLRKGKKTSRKLMDT